MSIQQKYNTKAAALYRDKISALAQGKSWSIESSSAQSYAGSFSSGSSQQHSSSRNGNGASMNSSKSYQDFGGGYQDSGSNGGYQNFNTPEFRDQKEGFFNRIQEQNASRPEWVSADIQGWYSAILIYLNSFPQSFAAESRRKICWFRLLEGTGAQKSIARVLRYHGFITGKRKCEFKANFGELKK